MQEREASKNHAAGESTTVTKDVDEPEKATPESADMRKICQHQVATAESLLGLQSFILGRRVRYTSKASPNRAMWSSVFAVLAFVLVLLVFLGNIWGYLIF